MGHLPVGRAFVKKSAANLSESAAWRHRGCDGHRFGQGSPEIERIRSYGRVERSSCVLYARAEPGTRTVVGNTLNHYKVIRQLGSGGHRRKIAGDYELSGLGIAIAPDGTYYLTQLFVAKPQSEVGPGP